MFTAALVGMAAWIGFLYLAIRRNRLTVAALREGAEAFRMFAEAAPQLTWICRPDGWNIYFNQRWVDYTGLTLEESYGHGWNKPFHPDDQQRALDAWEQATQHGAPYDLECRLRRRDGQYRWFVIRGVPQRDAGGAILKWFGTCIDIHDRREAEEALRESQEVFATAFHSSPAGTALLTSDGRYVEVNAACSALLGYAPEEMIGQTTLDLGILAAPDRERVVSASDPGSGAVRPVEAKVRRRDGSFLDVSIRNAFVTLRGVPHRLTTIVDISERKQAESARSEREQELEALVENSPDIVSRFDRQFRHLYVNRVITEATGMPASEFIGKTHGELGMPRELQAEWHAVLEDVFVSGKERELDFEFPTPDGPRFYQSRLVPERAPDGGIRTVLNIARDITARRNAEAAMRASEARLQFVLEASGIGYWDLDTVSNKTLRSLRHDECFGYTELLPSWSYETFINHVHPADRERVSRTFQEASAGRGEYNMELRTVWPDQSVHWLLTIGQFVRDAAGQTIRVLGVVLDVSERKRTEEALKESEERFEKAFQSGPIGLVIIRSSDRKIVEVNESFERLSGHTRAECLGHSSRELGILPTEEIEKQYGALHEKDALRNVELAFRDKAGRQRTVLMSVEMLTLRGESHSIASVLDITERKAAEEALQKSEASLETAQSHARVGSWEMFLLSRTSTWSREMFRIFQREESLGAPPFDEGIESIYPEDRERFQRGFGQAFEERREFRDDVRIVRQDGNIRWLEMRGEVICDEAGQPIQMIGTSQDVTERKIAELEVNQLNAELEQRVFQRTQALRDSEQLFAVAVQAARAGVWDWDIESGKLNWSPDLFRMFGFEPGTAEATFDDWHSVMHADDVVLAEKSITDAIEHHTRLDVEYRIVLGEGDLRWIAALGDTLYDDEGKPRRMSGVCLDITDRKRAEIELRNLAAELRVANQELEAFSYSVSHDLRAPLRGVDGYVGMLREDYADRLGAEGNRMLGVVSSEARRMGRLIDDLLSFSRMGRQKMARTLTDMTSIARMEFEHLTSAASESAPRFELHPLPPALGDTAMLGQVFANLLANAIKFSRNQADPVIEVGGRRGHGEVIFYVKDNGVGFDERYVHKLFGVFQRLHSEQEFEGTGVGLALVQRIIHRHGGKVWAESKPDDGATFYFSLPVLHARRDV
jgi:PAS domain S-box-containing protein